MSALESYLKQINSIDSQWGIWVNPENPTEEFRVGQYCFDNGGMSDGWVGVGSCDRLSFGFQSDSDAFEEAAAQAMVGHKYNKEALYEAFCNGELASQLQSQIRANIDAIHEEWADAEVSLFIEEELPAILEAAKSEVYA